MWLAPDPRYSAADIADVWHCAEQSGITAAVMMFHSSELMPGGSPFRPDAASITDLLACLDAFFSHVRRLGDGFATLGRLAEEVTAGPPLATMSVLKSSSSWTVWTTAGWSVRWRCWRRTCPRSGVATSGP
jgi:hypothetical protein